MAYSALLRRVATQSVLGYTHGNWCAMKVENLAQIVSDLSPEEQSAVREFIVFLKERQSQQPTTTFQAAIDEFIGEHRELLRRLAK